MGVLAGRDRGFLWQGHFGCLPFFPAGNNIVWAAHINTLGGTSARSTAALVVQPPAQPIMDAQVQGKAVHLSWQDCATTQPLDRYRVSVGAKLETSQLLGYTSGTSFDIVEGVSGKRVYWGRRLGPRRQRRRGGYREVESLPSIDEAIKDLEAGLDDLASDLGKEGADRIAAINAEINARVNGLAAEASARAQALTAEASDRAQALAQEASTRTQALTAEAQAGPPPSLQLRPSCRHASAPCRPAWPTCWGPRTTRRPRHMRPANLAHYNDKLYRARRDVTGTLPTDTAAWELVGDYKSIADAVIAQAAALQENRSTLTQVQARARRSAARRPRSPTAWARRKAPWAARLGPSPA